MLRQVNVPSATVFLRIVDGAVPLDDTTPRLTLNGHAAALAENRAGNVLELTFAPTTLQTPAEIQSATLTYQDTAGHSFTNQWSFMNLKAVYLPPTPVASENFDEYSVADTVPTVTPWQAWNFTTPDSGADTFDLTSAQSDAYLNFVAVGLETFSHIEGDMTNVRPGETLNGHPLATLASGNVFVAESANRTGSQVQFATSPAFDMSKVTNAVLAFSSLYKQSQNNLGAIEYSVDDGVTWMPVIYYLDGGKFGSDPADVVVQYDGAIDAVATFQNPNPDTAIGPMLGVR